MQVFETISSLRDWRTQWFTKGESVAFVPTMGNLHAGHLKLVKAAKQKCDRVVVSIFVNPMQFGANEDLDKYPKTIEQDKAYLTELGVDALFLPQVDEMYPRGLGAQTTVEVPHISERLCGASRPGHFRGVATVVCKLFNMVLADHAFFGEKDFQQLQVIRAMAADLSCLTTIHGIATERESDGLAMSSRNGYLSAQERQQATAIYRALQNIKTALLAGKRDFEQLCEEQAQALTSAGFRMDYLHICDTEDLTPARADSTQVVVLVAAYMGTTRLIDNIVVDLS